MPKVVMKSGLAGLLPAGGLVFVPGSSGAPLAFMDELMREPERSRNLRLLTSYVPGFNPLDIDALHPTARVTGLFMQPSLARAQRERRYRLLPLSFSGFVRHLREEAAPDLTVVQLSAPDAQGRCSLGPAAEFTPLAIGRSRRVLGVINAQTPRMRDAPGIDYASLDFVCEDDSPLPTYAPASDAESRAIGAHIATLLEDGSTVQMGLGKVPTALTGLLKDRRGLRMHSGMLTDGFAELAEAGALDPDFRHTACVVLGTADFYRWSDSSPLLRIAGCEHTHDPAVLLQHDRLVAVNSAIEVDLFGQCNLEHVGGRSISGAGGAPDFARAARHSRGGSSIVALGATHTGGAGSRIVASLSGQAIATLPRVDVDYVVTEYGVARLAGTCVHERAEALMAVAAPQFRAALGEAWRAIAARL